MRVQNGVNYILAISKGGPYEHGYHPGCILAGNLFGSMPYALSMKVLCLIVLLLSVQHLQLAFLFLSILGGLDTYVIFSVVVSLDFE